MINCHRHPDMGELHERRLFGGCYHRYCQISKYILVDRISHGSSATRILLVGLGRSPASICDETSATEVNFHWGARILRPTTLLPQFDKRGSGGPRASFPNVLLPYFTQAMA